MSVVQVCLQVGAGLSAATSACAACKGYQQQRHRRNLRFQAQGITIEERRVDTFGLTGVYARVLAYLVDLTRQLDLMVTESHVGSKQVARSEWFTDNHSYAGLAELVSCQAYKEARLRLGFALLLVGAVVGSILSGILMVMGAVAGALYGWVLPRLALQALINRRVSYLEKELPELLEVTALGLRSGLSFDRSFALYAGHFDTSFSKECFLAQQQWTLGLKTREQALRDLANGYESIQFKRVMESIIRALRFGSTLSGELEQAAAESRSIRKSRRQEQVAKAPVKMMIPTGTLILPAMLLLVLGPVLLEMSGGF